MRIGDIVTTKEIKFNNGEIQYPSKTGKIVLIVGHKGYGKTYYINSIDKKTGRAVISICTIDQIEVKQKID